MHQITYHFKKGGSVKTSLKNTHTTQTQAVYLVDELIQVLQPAKAAVHEHAADSPFIL